MKRGAPLKDDFFDPASLALEEEEELELVTDEGASARVISLEDMGAITPAAGFQLELEGPHRIQGEFQDPLAEIHGAVSLGEAAPAAALSDVAALPDVAAASELNQPSAVLSVANWAGVNGHGEHERRAEMLESIFALVLCELPFAELTHTATQAIAKAIGVEAASLLEIDRAQQDFFFRAVTGDASEKLKSIRLPLATGFAGDVASKRSAELVQDVAGDARFSHAVSLMAGSGISNAMAAPVLVGGELFGVFEVFNKQAGGAFTDFDLATLERGATALGKVLEVRFFAAWMARRG